MLGTHAFGVTRHPTFRGGRVDAAVRPQDRVNPFRDQAAADSKKLVTLVPALGLLCPSPGYRARLDKNPLRWARR